MYSPKIREDLIPRIHRAAKAAKTPMTKWVSQVVELALPGNATAERLTESLMLRESAVSAHGKKGAAI